MWWGNTAYHLFFFEISLSSRFQMRGGRLTPVVVVRLIAVCVLVVARLARDQHGIDVVMSSGQPVLLPRWRVASLP